MMGQKLNVTPQRIAESILLVEDDVLVCETIELSLSRLGYAVIVANNADEAMAILKSTPVDLVLSDVIMPGKMNGADLAREIQQRWPGTRILLTTGYAETYLAKVQVPAGIEMLPKPYASATLNQLVRAAIAV